MKNLLLKINRYSIQVMLVIVVVALTFLLYFLFSNVFLTLQDQKYLVEVAGEESSFTAYLDSTDELFAENEKKLQREFVLGEDFRDVMKQPQIAADVADGEAEEGEGAGSETDESTVQPAETSETTETSPESVPDEVVEEPVDVVE